jgi:hypothetical protein
MTSNSLTFDSFEPCGAAYLATAGRYVVTLDSDDDASNPWDDCDGMTPLLSVEGRDGFAEYGGESLSDFFGKVTPAWVSRHWRKIAAIAAFPCPVQTYDALAREHAADYQESLSESRFVIFADELESLHRADKVAALADLYNLRGWPAANLTRSGYSQGDSLDLLFVATPEHVKTCGMNAKTHDWAADFKGDADTYAAWAFGDVFSYAIDDLETGESLRSCAGFVGTLHDSGYIFDQINADIADLERVRLQARRARLKTLIANRVPLQARAGLLQESATPAPY